MPQPPDIPDFAKINFVTNYALLGCEPPVDLFVQFAKEPAKDLALLFLLPDLVDIGQAIFDPKAGRKRKPGRHGRKKRRLPGLPDTSDLIGQRARAVLNPHNALKFGPVNFMFRIWNRFELVSFTAAVIEGVTDIGYEGLLGVLSANPNFCREFARLVRTAPEPFTDGGVGPIPAPMQITELQHSEGFSSTPWECVSSRGPFVVALQVTIMNTSETRTIRTTMGLWGDGPGPIDETPSRELAPGQTRTFEVWGKAKKNEVVRWGPGEREGYFLVLEANLVAFSEADVPWPF